MAMLTSSGSPKCARKGSMLIEMLTQTRIWKNVPCMNVKDDVQMELPEKVSLPHLQQHSSPNIFSPAEMSIKKSCMVAKTAMLPSPSRKLTVSYPSHSKLGDQLHTYVKFASMYSKGAK